MTRTKGWNRNRNNDKVEVMTAAEAGEGKGTGAGRGTTARRNRSRDEAGTKQGRGTGAWTGVATGIREIFHPLCVFMYSSERKFRFLHIQFLRTLHCTYVCEDRARIHWTGYAHMDKIKCDSYHIYASFHVSNTTIRTFKRTTCIIFAGNNTKLISVQVACS